LSLNEELKDLRDEHEKLKNEIITTDDPMLKGEEIDSDIKMFQ